MGSKRVSVGFWLTVVGCLGLAFGAQGLEEGVLRFAARSADIELSKKTYTYKTVDAVRAFFEGSGESVMRTFSISFA